MGESKGQTFRRQLTIYESLGVAAALLLGISIFFGETIKNKWLTYQSKPFRGTCAIHLTKNFDNEIKRFPGGWNNIRGIGISAFIRDYCDCVADDLLQIEFPFSEFSERGWRKKNGVTFTAFSSWSKSKEGLASLQRCAIRAEEAGRRFDPKLGKVLVLEKKVKK